MKTLMLAASALTMVAVPAHAQLLGGGGQSTLTGTLNGTLNSTLRVPTDTVRTTTRSTVRSDVSTRGSQNVDRRNGSVAIDRSGDASIDATAGQLLGTPAGNASGTATGSANASGSGNANAQLIGTDAVTGAARGTASSVRDAATATVGSARERVSGAAGQAGSLVGSTNGTASGAGMLNSGVIALAGSGAAQGAGAFAVAPGMPVELASGERLGTVRDVVATRSGEVRQLVVDTGNGLASIPAGNLTTSGSLLIAGRASGSAISGAPVEASDAD